jgi:hypothetical protein
MSLIKKIDVNAHFAARRAMRSGKMRPLGRPGASVKVQATRAKIVPAMVREGLPCQVLSTAPSTIAKESDEARAPKGSRSRPL